MKRQETVFISNPEVALNPECVTDGRAIELIRKRAPRHVWIKADRVVLPVQPDRHFMSYAAGLGARAKVIVPTTLNLKRLTMCDALQDDAVQRAVGGKHTTTVSYVPDKRLAELVRDVGGAYAANPAAELGRKTLFESTFGDIVSVPLGVCLNDYEKIVQTVLALVAQGCTAVVREDIGGGGIGLYIFKSAFLWNDHSIRRKLGRERPMIALVERWMEDIVGTPTVYLHSDEGLLATSTQVLTNGEYVGSQLPCPASITKPEVLMPLAGRLLKCLLQYDYCGPGGFDLGQRWDGSLVGFELNARYTALETVIRIAQLLFKECFEDWSARGRAVLSFDHFVLSHTMDFMYILRRLEDRDMLATPKNPNGIVISIPPFENIGGFVIVSERGHAGCIEWYKRLADLLGGENVFDQPLRAA